MILSPLRFHQPDICVRARSNRHLSSTLPHLPWNRIAQQSNLCCGAPTLGTSSATEWVILLVGQAMLRAFVWTHEGFGSWWASGREDDASGVVGDREGRSRPAPRISEGLWKLLRRRWVVSCVSECVGKPLSWRYLNLETQKGAFIRKLRSFKEGEFCLVPWGA
jgi:hypothetical protein